MLPCHEGRSGKSSTSGANLDVKGYIHLFKQFSTLHVGYPTWLKYN